MVETTGTGFEAVTANDGAEALKKAKEICPDLVILDVMMPKIEDGIHTYQEFRTDENLACIPVIMLSAIAKKTFNYSIRMLNPRKNVHIAEPEAYMEKPPDAGELSALYRTRLPGLPYSSQGKRSPGAFGSCGFS